VVLTDAEKRRITLWLDCNSNELGAYTKTDEQRQGKLVWPELDCDPKDPLGVETDRPLGNRTEIGKNFSAAVVSGAPYRPVASYDRRSNTLTLYSIRTAHGFRVSLFDASGRLLWGSGVLSGPENAPFSVRNVPYFASGVIVARVQNAGSVSTIRCMAGQRGL
jgi:hypothetical protein